MNMLTELSRESQQHSHLFLSNPAVMRERLGHSHEHHSRAPGIAIGRREQFFQKEGEKEGALRSDAVLDHDDSAGR